MDYEVGWGATKGAEVWKGFETEVEKGLACMDYGWVVDVAFGGVGAVLKEGLKPNCSGFTPSAAGGDLLVVNGEVMLFENGDDELYGFWLEADAGFKNGLVGFDYGFAA